MYKLEGQTPPAQVHTPHPNDSSLSITDTMLEFYYFGNISNMPSAYSCELGAHLLCFLDEASLQHVLGTLGINEAVCSVQGLSLVHPPSCFFYVACMLEGRGAELADMERSHSEQKHLCVQSFPPHLVDLGFDEEELNERRCAVDGCINELQRQAWLADEVKVLCQEVLYPQQGGGGFLLPIICAHI